MVKIDQLGLLEFQFLFCRSVRGSFLAVDPAYGGIGVSSLLHEVTNAVTRANAYTCFMAMILWQLTTKQEGFVVRGNTS